MSTFTLYTKTVETGGLLKYFKIDKVIDSITGYIESRIELVKMEAKEEMYEAASKAIFALVLVALFAFALMLFSFAGAVYLESVLDGEGLGYLIVGLVYAIPAAGLLIFNKKLKLTQRIKSFIAKNSTTN